MKNKEVEMSTLIISGGNINSEFALEFYKIKAWTKVIGVDKGLEFLYKNEIMPTDIVGDFDSLSPDILEYYLKQKNIKTHRFQPEKNATDTQIAIEIAVAYESREIYVLGGMGSRVDHTLANIQILSIPLEKKIPAFLINENNKVFLIDKDISLEKEDQLGNYISLLPLTTLVTGVTLKGVKYPLHNHTITSNDSLGVSNEFDSQTANIELEEGILIVIQSKD